MWQSIVNFFMAIIESIQDLKEYKAQRYIDKVSK